MDLWTRSSAGRLAAAAEQEADLQELIEKHGLVV